MRSSWLAFATKSVCARLISASAVFECAQFPFERLEVDQPDIAPPGEAANDRAAGFARFDQAQGLRVTKSDPKVLIDDVRAKEVARRQIRNDHPFTAGNKHRRVGIFDQLFHQVGREFPDIDRFGLLRWLRGRQEQRSGPYQHHGQNDEYVDAAGDHGNPGNNRETEGRPGVGALFHRAAL